MDIHAVMAIVIIIDNKENEICQRGTSVDSNLLGIENGAENGNIEAITDILLLGSPMPE